MARGSGLGNLTATDKELTQPSRQAAGIATPLLPQVSRPQAPIAPLLAENFSSASEWDAIASAGDKLVQIGGDLLEREALRRRAQETADFQNTWRREDTDAQDHFAGDPAGYRAWADERVKTAVENVSPDLAPHAQEWLSARFDASYGSLLNQKREQDNRLTAQSLSARLKDANSDVMGLVMAGKIDSPEYHAAVQTYQAVNESAVSLGFKSTDEAALDIKDLSARAAGVTASNHAIDLEREQGHEAAVRFLQTSILQNDQLSMTAAQKRATYNSAIGALNTERQLNQADREAAVARSREIRESLKADPGSLDPGEVNDLLVELRTYGSAGEHARLASSAAVAEAIAPYAKGSVPLPVFAKRLQDMRGEVNMDPAVGSAIAEAADKTEIPLGYLVNTARRESRFDPNAEASTSSAAGLYQFTDRTWRDVLARHGADFGLAPDASKTDPRAAALMAGALALDNEEALVQAKLPVDDKSLYVLHFAGASGGTALLKADPNAAAADVLPDAAKANRAVFYDRGGNARTVGAVISRLTSGFDGSPDGETAGLPSAGDVARSARVLFVKQAREAWPSLQASIDRGRLPSADDIQAVRYAATLSGDPKWQAEVNAAATAVGIAPIAASAPVAETSADLDRLSAQYAEGGWTVDESTTFKAIEDQFNLQQKQLAEDPVGFAVKFRGAKPLDPLNFSDPSSLSDGLNQRVTLSRGVTDGQGIPSGSILSTADKTALASAISSSFSTKADLAQGAAAAAGRERPRGPRADENAFAFLSAIPDQHLIPTLEQPEIKSAIGGALRTQDPVKFSAAMTFLDQMWGRAPEEVKNLFGDGAVGAVQDWQAKLRYFPPEQLMAELKLRDDPQASARRNDLAREGLKLAPAKTIDQLTSALDPPAVGWSPVELGARLARGSLDVPVDPRTRDAALADYATVFGQRYAMSNDAAMAHQQAIEEMRLYWGRSDVNRGRLTLYAPENVYKPVNGSYDWMGKQLESDLSARYGKVPDDYAIIADRNTEADIAAGKAPSYLISVKQADGSFDIARTPDNKPLRYHWSADQANTNAREEFQRQRDRVLAHGNDYVTRATRAAARFLIPGAGPTP